MKKNLWIFFVAYLIGGHCQSTAPPLDGTCGYIFWNDVAVVCKMVTKISPELHAYIANLTENMWYQGMTFHSSNISKLQPGSFSGYGINTLILEEDNIENVLPGAFDGLKNLTELYVVKNKLTSVEKRFFSEDIVDLLVLDLSDNLIAHVEPNAFGALKKMRSVILDGNNLDMLPEKAFLGTNISTLSVARNRLRHFEPGFFKTLPNLQNFNAAYNVLSGILPNDLETNLKLERVELQNNYLVTVQRLSIPTVTFLNLSSNHLVSLIYANFTSVQTLDLSDNLVSTLNTTTFGSLRELIMNRNMLSETYAFETTIKTLNRLTLSYNNLHSFNTSVFKKHGLEYLDLSGNYLNELDFSHFLSLELKLRDNRFKNLNMTTFVRFLDFDLSRNGFTEISYGFFDRMLVLWSLDMSHNQISYIAPGAFRDQWRLRFLDLSHNNIQTLPPGIFLGLYFMNLLNLSHNLLTKVNPGVFHHYHILMELDLSYNSIHVENLESVIDHKIHITHVNLDHNNLSCSYLRRFDRPDNFYRSGMIKRGTSNNVTNYRGNACILAKHSASHNEFDLEISAKLRLRVFLVLSILLVILTNVLLSCCVYKRILWKKYNQFRLFMNDPPRDPPIVDEVEDELEDEVELYNFHNSTLELL